MNINTPVRLVSYAPDGSTCTLNIGGEEVYFNRKAEERAQGGAKIKPVAWLYRKWEGYGDDVTDSETLAHVAACNGADVIPLCLASEVERKDAAIAELLVFIKEMLRVEPEHLHLFDRAAVETLIARHDKAIGPDFEDGD